MSLKQAFDVSASGMSAQRTRMETIASNLANVRTTRTAEGGPYRRRAPVFVTEAFRGRWRDALNGLRKVKVETIAEDPSAPVMRYEPGHPDADAAGYVAYPNVDAAQEMVDMLSATRSYEANINVLKSLRTMVRSALDILR